MFFLPGCECAVCWVVGAPCHHTQADCARFQQLTDVRYRGWKADLQLPKFHCFKCCLPQVSTVFAGCQGNVGVDHPKEKGLYIPTILQGGPASWQILSGLSVGPAGPIPI